MNASWVVVGSAVGVGAPMVAVPHTVEAVAAVRLVILVAGSMVVVALQRMTTLAGSGHGPSVIPPGLRAALLPRMVHYIRYSRSSLYSNDGRRNFSVMGFELASISAIGKVTASILTSRLIFWPPLIPLEAFIQRVMAVSRKALLSVSPTEK